MRTALFAGVLSGAVNLWLSLPCALMNADFAYMCVAAARLDSGALTVTPYFPPGFPILLWLVVHCGLTALTAGMLLSALGTALSAGALTYLARRFGLPAAPALALGLVGATIPVVFQIAFNPHLDALYTGLSLTLIAAAFRLMADKPHASSTFVFALCVALLLTFRYHAVLVVIPVIVAVLINRRASARRAALIALAVALIAIAWVYWAMYVTYGHYVSAATTQVATGKVYRELPPNQEIAIFEDYAAWLKSAPPVSGADILAGIRANWPIFLVRKPVLAGLAAWLLALLFFRRWPPGTLLVPFILLYTLAVSPTYFTPRASALTELAGLALVAAALGMLVQAGMDKPGSPRRLRLSPALTGALVFVAALGGLAYNVYREERLVEEWSAQRKAVARVEEYLARTTPGGREAIYGSIDYTGWILNPPYNLPGPTYSRYWMDDPQVVWQVAHLLSRTSPSAALDRGQPYSTVVLWRSGVNRIEVQLARRLDADPQWREDSSPEPGVRIWRRME